MTMRYAHPTPENMKKAVVRLEEIFTVPKDNLKDFYLKIMEERKYIYK